MYKVGHKVTTPDNEQGYVSAIYPDAETGQLEVDILEEDAVAPDDTTTFEYEFNDGVVIDDDQTPCLRDITPYGRVSGLLTFAEGIIGIHTEDEIGCAAVWVDEERMAYLAGRLDCECYHWVDMKDWDDLLEIFDLQTDENGIVSFKGIRHPDIADACKLEVILQDGNVRNWNAAVDGNGNILEVETEDKRLKTLAELRETGIIEATLISRYNIVEF